VESGASQLGPYQTHPSCCQMEYTIDCIVLGERTIFQVNINEALSVYKLKRGIKNETPIKFNNVDADQLTLYRVEVGKSQEKRKRIDELERSYRNLDGGCKELDDEEQRLSELFGVSPPEGKKYYILVVLPQSKSIDP